MEEQRYNPEPQDSCDELLIALLEKCVVPALVKLFQEEMECAEDQPK